MRFKRILAITAGAALAFGIAACGEKTEPGGKSDFAEGTTMARIADAGTIKIGTKFDQPGFGLKGLDGKPAGFDVEIGKIIAEKLGIGADKIEWVESPSKVREEYIINGRVDLVVATYTINDKRKERIAFAGPYYEAGQNIMVMADDATITGPDAFKDGTKKVCSVTGSTPGEEIKKYVKDVNTQLVLFDTYDKCRDALQSGQVHAVTTDNVILLGFIAKSDGKFKMAGDNFTKEPYGIGVKKDDKDFRKFINDILEEIFADGRWKKAWDGTAGKFGATLGEAPKVNRY